MGFALVLKVEVLCSILQVKKDCSYSVFSHIARDGGEAITIQLLILTCVVRGEVILCIFFGQVSPTSLGMSVPCKSFPPLSDICL